MKTFEFVISTPEGNLYHGEVVKVSLRGTEGDLAVMANHIPFITSVKPCDCSFVPAEGIEKSLNVGSGILSVTPKSVILMSGSAKWI